MVHIIRSIEGQMITSICIANINFWFYGYFWYCLLVCPNSIT